MRYLVGLMCVLALGAMPLVGCIDEETNDGTGGVGGEGGMGGEGGIGGEGGAEGCADWAGDWTLSALSCDGVPEDASGIAYRFAADCTGQMILTESGTCEATVEMTFTPGEVTTTVDLGAVTCSAGCTPEECQATADWAQPYESAMSRSGETLTSTSLVTAQMVSDGVTPCQVAETMVSVLAAK